jgi:hypothetical protein
VKFATEAAMLANQSGSRGTQARVEYEQFLDEVGQAVIKLILRFGATLADPSQEQDMMLLEALQGIETMDVIESSTSYKDPSYEMQMAMQMTHALMPFIQAGIVNPLPLAMKILRAFGERDPGKYLNQPQNTAPGGPGAPGVPAGGMLPPAMPPGMPPGPGSPPMQPAGGPAMGGPPVPPGAGGPYMPQIMAMARQAAMGAGRG